MTRGDRPASRRASDDAADPLDEALRQIGADMLDEPVPERLRQILRQAQRGASPTRARRPRPPAARDRAPLSRCRADTGASSRAAARSGGTQPTGAGPSPRPDGWRSAAASDLGTALLPAPPRRRGLDQALLDETLAQARALPEPAQPRGRPPRRGAGGGALARPRPRPPVNVKSVSKSVIAALVGGGDRARRAGWRRAAGRAGARRPGAGRRRSADRRDHPRSSADHARRARAHLGPQLRPLGEQRRLGALRADPAVRRRAGRRACCTRPAAITCSRRR